MDGHPLLRLSLLIVLVAGCSDSTSSPAAVTTAAPSTAPAPSTRATSTTTTTSIPSSTSTSTSTTTTITTTTTTTTTTTSTPSTTSPPPPTTVPPTATTVPTPPTTSIPAGASVVVRRIPTDQRVVALTFDAGADLGHTSAILDVLADRDVLASFGITGEFAEDHPDHVARMAREGHVVMNHSYSHASFTGVSSDEVLSTTAERQADLRAADAVLEPLIGGTTRPFWRPPFGDHDSGVLADVGAIGYGSTIMWTFDSLGWRGITSDEIVDRVLTEAEPGAIVVLHVGSESQDAAALPRIIDGLRADGYSFTTVRALTGWS